MFRVAVFDANVLLSGVGWRGKPYRCLELARIGLIEGVTCQELMDEVAEKLETRLRLSTAQINDTIADLLGYLRLVKIAHNLKVISADPSDDKVLECAIVGGATHIVTGDRQHLLPLGNYRNIPIVSPADFFALALTP